MDSIHIFELTPGTDRDLGSRIFEEERLRRKKPGNLSLSLL